MDLGSDRRDRRDGRHDDQTDDQCIFQHFSTTLISPELDAPSKYTTHPGIPSSKAMNQCRYPRHPAHNEPKGGPSYSPHGPDRHFRGYGLLRIRIFRVLFREVCRHKAKCPDGIAPSGHSNASIVIGRFRSIRPAPAPTPCGAGSGGSGRPPGHSGTSLRRRPIAISCQRGRRRCPGDWLPSASRNR